MNWVLFSGMGSFCSLTEPWMRIRTGSNYDLREGAR